MAKPANQYSLEELKASIPPEVAAAELLTRRMCRRNLSPFVKRCFHTVDPGAYYKHNWHIDLICEYLEAAYNREIKNLIINIPPRFLKSLCATVAFPAWALGQNPSERIMSASGVASLAVKHSMDTRKILYEDWYRNTFPETVLSEHQDAKSRYETTRGGHRIATSVGGSSVGEGGRIKIIDDPIDPHKISMAKIEEANTWYDHTWSTRSDDPERTVEIIIMQRLHINDLTGHVLKLKDWTHLKIPQEPKKRTHIIFPRSGREMVREVGQLIHPERFTQEAIAVAKAIMGTYGYDSQHQQEPTAIGGNRVRMEWFPRHTTLPFKYDEVVQSWDTGNKPKEINNPSVCETYGKFNNQWFLIDVFKKQLAYPDLKRMVKALADRDHPDTILVEDKASGQQIIQEFTMQATGEERLPIVGIEPEGDKVFRMETQLASLESGLISLPDNEKLKVSWLFDFEQNLTMFPMNSEWDEIDAMSQFLKWLRKRDGVSVSTAVPVSLTKTSSFRGAGR